MSDMLEQIKKATFITIGTDCNDVVLYKPDSKPIKELLQLAKLEDTISQYGLMVRPSITGSWIAGVWQGVSCSTPGRAYCEEGTEVERETISQAVNDCIAQLQRRKNHERRN